MMKDQPNRTQRTSVLVVGAGPTGMTAAIELARRGVDLDIDLRQVDDEAVRPLGQDRREADRAAEVDQPPSRLGIVLGD